MNPTQTTQPSSKGLKMLLVIIGFVILITVSYKLSESYHVLDTPVVEETPAATTTPATTTPVVEAPITHSNGTITFTTPSDFGLATTKEQILVNSYIPPCEENFDYCLYYNGNEFKNTNFGGVGIRIKKRADLPQVSQCLTAQPLGFTNMKSTIVASSSLYSVSLFAPIGDAAMGHYAAGELYRLAYNGTCHEFETRISATRFENYPEGSITEFGTTSQALVNGKIKDMLNSVTLNSGEKVEFKK
ncbi:MAG: hypothetical protein V4576_04115 [Patescibacteria group bacterium]